jgi:hypothetical protein
MLATLFSNDAISLPTLVVALIQFPLYGAIAGWGIARGGIGWAVAAAVVLVHVLAAIACFSGLIPNFS